MLDTTDPESIRRGITGSIEEHPALDTVIAVAGITEPRTGTRPPGSSTWQNGPSKRSLLADQAVGGGIAWAAGEIPLVIVIIALVTQWSRQDRRIAGRIDRHLDQGADDSWEAYKAMLTRFQHRDRSVDAGRPHV